MENEETNAPTGSEELKKRLINHLDDLREFARLSESERKEVIDSVTEHIAENSIADAYKFSTGVEYILRLSAIDDFPKLYVETIERGSPDAETPQTNVERFLASRHAQNEARRPDDGTPQMIVAESAMMITSGTGARLDDRSVLIMRDRQQNGLIIECPFGIGGQIAFKGYDAILNGRDISGAAYEDFEKKIRILDFPEPDDLAEIFDHPNFRFFAFGSTKQITDTLDEISFTDEVIEINEK